MERDLTLSAEWETALLNSLSKCGKVIHERDFGGTTYADVYWESPNSPNHNFVADITTISDKGLDQLNPFGALFEEIKAILLGRGLDPRHFWLHVGVQNESREKGGPKVRLKLTGRARFYETIFGAGFYEFLAHMSTIRSHPRSTRSRPTR